LQTILQAAADSLSASSGESLPQDVVDAIISMIQALETAVLGNGTDTTMDEFSFLRQFQQLSNTSLQILNTSSNQTFESECVLIRRQNIRKVVL